VGYWKVRPGGLGCVCSIGLKNILVAVGSGNQIQATCPGRHGAGGGGGLHIVCPYNHLIAAHPTKLEFGFKHWAFFAGSVLPLHIPNKLHSEKGALDFFLLGFQHRR